MLQIEKIIMFDHYFIIINLIGNLHHSSLFNNHLISGRTWTVLTPIHPKPASHNRSSGAPQSMWEEGEGSPGCGIEGEGQHRRKVVSIVIPSSGDNKCLQVKIWVIPLVLTES